MKYYKVLGGGRKTIYGRGTWYQNKWMPPVAGDLVPCKNGYHVCRRENIIFWLGEEIYECFIGDEFIDAGDKVVAREACLGARLDWTPEKMAAFARDCADRVEHLNTPFTPDASTWASLAIRFAAWGSARTAANAAINAVQCGNYGSCTGERAWQTNRLFYYLGGE